MRRGTSVNVSTAALLWVLALAGAVHAQGTRFVSEGSPPVECMAKVDQSSALPGYMSRSVWGAECLPFAYRSKFVSPETYATGFTDAKIKAEYEACRKDKACLDRLTGAPNVAPPGHQFRATGSSDPTRIINPNAAVDLKAVRRPADFGRQPLAEPIAEADGRTYTVEFTVPAEAYEILHLGRKELVKLRGWYVEGKGVDDGAGDSRRALIVLIAGRSVETTATPQEFLGSAAWREYLYLLNQAGFDVLTFDKRGHGVSGGLNDSNTLEQGKDMLRALDALESGKGLRLITPNGELLEGGAAGGRLLAGHKAKEFPVILGGSSQGAMATAWAMQANFIGDCTYDLTSVSCAPPLGYNVKAALMLATFEGGLGNRSAPADVDVGALQEGRSREEFNIVTLPSSEILAGIHKWPAVFFGKGLWDFAEALEATYDSYRRIKGLKEIAVVRGPHSEISWGDQNMQHMADRMIAFAKAAVLGKHDVPGAARFNDLKGLVLSSPPSWSPPIAPAPN